MSHMETSFSGLESGLAHFPMKSASMWLPSSRRFDHAISNIDVEICKSKIIQSASPQLLQDWPRGQAIIIEFGFPIRKTGQEEEVQ